MSAIRPQLALLALLSLPAAVAAAPENSPPARPRPDPVPKPRADELRRSLSLFFVHRARIELDLDDQQALRLFPLVERVEAARQDSAERRGELTGRLRRLAEEPGATDQQVLELVQALDREEEAQRLAQDRARGEILVLLTPQQKARFVLFANRLRRDMEEQIRAIRQGADPPPRRGSPALDRLEP